jgi:hypothetical protein
MSGDVREFSNIETWAVFKSPPPLQGKAQKEIHAILTETLVEHAPSCVTVKYWVTQFKSGDFPTCIVIRPEHPKTVPTMYIIDTIHEKILVTPPDFC